MPSEKQIQEAFEKIATDIPGFIAASLVDLESGMTLGARTACRCGVAAHTAGGRAVGRCGARADDCGGV